MQKLHAVFFKVTCALLVLAGALQVSAQTRPAYCPRLFGLPDTFYACKNTRPLLPIALIDSVQAGTELLDTLWSPRNTLTNPDSIATFAFVDLTSINYTLTLRSLRPNIAVNSNFDGGTTGWTSDYFEKTTTLPAQPRFFLVTDDPAKANPTFATIPDHTPAPSAGNMLVVNGASGAGANNLAVWRQTVPVIPGETYELQAWATSVLPLNPATLQWRVDGNLINAARSPLSLTPIVPQWLPMIAYYVPTGTTMTVEIINLETSGDPGNDFALDDITIRPLCIQRDSVYVNAINLRPLLDFANPKFGCQQDTVEFKADTTAPASGGNTPPATVPDRYFWSFGDGQTSTLQSPTHIYTRRDTFRVVLKVYKEGVNPNGTITCVDSVDRLIDLRREFHAGFIQDKDSVCKGGTVTFTDTSRPNTLPVKYFFGTGDSTRLKNPDYVYDTAGIFPVIQVVTDQYGCTDTARNKVVVIAPVDLSFSLSDTVICEGQTIRAKTLIDSSYREYTWDFGDGRVVRDSTSISQTYLTPGIFNVDFSATHSICPDVNTTRPVEVLATPRVNLGRDTFLCPNGQPLLLQNLNQTNASNTLYVWNTGDQTQQILVRHDGTYYLRATNAKGCSITDTLVVTRNCFLDIPTAFTPDGDGSSDYFIPRQTFSKGLTKFKMKIYNRWGQQVFETERLDGRGWDGKFNGAEQPVGVYLYFIEATLQNGAIEKYDGNVTLLR